MAHPIECGECDGQGEVVDPLDLDDGGLVICSDCGGTGVYEKPRPPRSAA